jgi:hypothetical protein
MAVARRHGLAAYFVVRQANAALSERQTEAFAALGSHAAG